MSEVKTLEFEVHESNDDILGRRYSKLVDGCLVHDLECSLVELGKETKTFETKKLGVVINTFDVEFTSYRLIYSEPVETRYAIVGVLSRVGNSNILDIDNYFKSNYLENEDYDIAVPDEVYSLELECEHCNSGRDCKKTFLMFDFKLDVFFQVAQGCLTGYIYFDAHSDVSSNFTDLYYEHGREVRASYNRRDAMMYDLTDLVRHSLSYFLELDELKFISRAASTPKIKSSVEKAQIHLLSGQDIIPDVTDELVEDFILKLESSGKLDEQTLKTFKEENLIPEFKAGYIIYLAYDYLNKLKNGHTKIEKEDKEPVKPSEYVGEVGEKIEVVVSYEKRIDFDTDFGSMSMYFFKMDEGNILVWRTAKYIENMFSGDRLILKGKVKNHNTYLGVKQTFVSYVKLLDIEEED